MSENERMVYLLHVARMVGQPDRPQQVLDFIDLVAKLAFGEVWR